jgi:hypothetical protein
MLKARSINEPQGERRVKACTWLPVTELDTINAKRGDISVSLFIRRAIRKALAEVENNNISQNNEISSELSGTGLPTRFPELASSNTRASPEVNPDGDSAYDGQ